MLQDSLATRVADSQSTNSRALIFASMPFTSIRAMIFGRIVLSADGCVNPCVDGVALHLVRTNLEAKMGRRLALQILRCAEAQASTNSVNDHCTVPDGQFAVDQD